MQAINPIGGLSNPVNASQVTPKAGDGPVQSFKALFDDALNNQEIRNQTQVALNAMVNLPTTIPNNSPVIAQAAAPEIERINERIRRQREGDTETEDVLTSQNVNQIPDENAVMSVVPFQFFMDKAIDGLESISQLEFKVNDLVDMFTQGKVSVEVVTIEMSHLNMVLSLATTVVTSATQTFKEIQQIAV